MPKTNKSITETPFNPFDGRDPEKVWEEIGKNKGPRITRKETIRQMKALSDKK